jgi:hypothetical protein
MAPGIRAASQRVCDTGENTSFSPCHSSTGTLIVDTSKSHGEVKASASSIQPSAESRTASAKFRTSLARMPASATTRRSDSGISGPRVVMWLAGSALIWAAVAMRLAASWSGSVAALLYSATLESAMPSNQSRPCASGGARLTSAQARVTRSGSSAAQARACGPPPDRPSTPNRSISR